VEPHVLFGWQASPGAQSLYVVHPQVVPFTQAVPAGLPVQSKHRFAGPQLVVVPMHAPGTSAEASDAPSFDGASPAESPVIASGAASGASACASAPPLLPELLPLPPLDSPPPTSTSRPSAPPASALGEAWPDVSIPQPATQAAVIGASIASCPARTPQLCAMGGSLSRLHQREDHEMP
jgi:hypothetical protein